MLVERYTDLFWIVTHFGFQQTQADKCIDFSDVQLDRQTSQSLPSAFSVQAHTFGGRGAGCGCRRHHHIEVRLLILAMRRVLR
jgi:hypothetical protein